MEFQECNSNHSYSSSVTLQVHGFLYICILIDTVQFRPAFQYPRPSKPQTKLDQDLKYMIIQLMI